jgi:hypothetical protein
MEQTNTNLSVVKLTDEQNNILTSLLESLPKDRQLSWLQLGVTKAKIKSALEAKFLEIQSYLLKYESLKVEELKIAIENYKKGLVQIPEIRKSFTRYLDKIGDELMSVQKEAESWDNLKKAEARFLELRKENEKVETEQSGKITEASKFKAHVVNEYLRISTEYEISLDKKILDEYLLALDKEYLDDGLKNKVIELENTLTNIKKPEPKRFTSILPEGYKLQHTVDELTKIHATIPAPNYDSILTRKISEMKSKFNLYFSDKANKDKAKEFLEKEQKENEDKLKSSTENSQAVNTLISNSGVGVSFSSIPPVKRSKVIDSPDGVDMAWEHTIITAFLSRWKSSRPRVGIKNSKKMTLEQMAKSLQEEDDNIPGLTYSEKEK